MMKEGLLSKNKTLWEYLDHYAEERSARTEKLQEELGGKNLADRPGNATYNASFLLDYFQEDETEV